MEQPAWFREKMGQAFVTAVVSALRKQLSLCRLFSLSGEKGLFVFGAVLKSRLRGQRRPHEPGGGPVAAGWGEWSGVENRVEFGIGF